MKRVDFPAIWDPLGLFFVKWGLSVQFPIKLNGKQLNYESSDLVRPTANCPRSSEWYQSMRNGAVVMKIPVAFLVNWFFVSYQRKRLERAFWKQFLLIVWLCRSLYGRLLDTFFWGCLNDSKPPIPIKCIPIRPLTTFLRSPSSSEKWAKSSRITNGQAILQVLSNFTGLIFEKSYLEPQFRESMITAL